MKFSYFKYISAIAFLIFTGCQNKTKSYFDKKIRELGNARITLRTRLEENTLFYKVDIFPPSTANILPLGDSEMVNISPLSYLKKQEKQHKFYNNLIVEGYGINRIGDEDSFMITLRDSVQMLNLYKKLLKDGYSIANSGTKHEYLQNLYFTPYDIFEESLSDYKILKLNLTDEEGYTYNGLEIPFSSFNIVRRADNTIEKMTTSIKKSVKLKQGIYNHVTDWEVSLK